jgi:cation:H+ antiporter
MVLPILGTLAGLVLLALAADHFVAGAARIAAHLRISPVVVGAVIIGFGTSTPELLVSGLAAAQGAVDMAAGNVVGSNVANLTLVLGTAAVITPITVRSPVLRREAPIALVAVLIFAATLQGPLGWQQGTLLTVLLVTSLALILYAARGGDPNLGGEVGTYLRGEPSLRVESLRTVLGLLGTLAGAQLLVWSATDIAARAGLSEGFVGLTVVAIGTSLPELATAVQSARRGEVDLIVGNLLGSNLFNAAAVGAAAAFGAGGQRVDATISGPGAATMAAIAVLATGFMVTGRRVVRWEGVLLLAAYAAVLPFLAG